MRSYVKPSFPLFDEPSRCIQDLDVGGNVRICVNDDFGIRLREREPDRGVVFPRTVQTEDAGVELIDVGPQRLARVLGPDPTRGGPCVAGI